MYNVVHKNHGVIGVHSPDRGFIPTKPHLGFKSGKTIPNGAKIDRSKPMPMRSEEVEQIDELSLDTLEKYKRAAGKRLRSLSPQYNWSPDSPVKKEIDKRVKGYRQAWQKIEDKV